jgi:hypothetical protein
LIKDWTALGQPESLAQALAAPTEVMEQSRILSLDKNLNVLAHMGLDPKQTCLESIWEAGENDYWDVI